jgi:hypothetical protein
MNWDRKVSGFRFQLSYFRFCATSPSSRRLSSVLPSEALAQAVGHVLTAMGLSEDHVKGALRFSWCHLTPKVDWPTMVEAIKAMCG